MSRGGKHPAAHREKRRARAAARSSSDRWFHPRLEALEGRMLLSITPSIITGQYVFYEQSAFDGNIAGVNAGDDAAIAIDKSAFIPGAGLANFENITSYSKGLNGLMIDLVGDGSHQSINADDFIFRTGADNAPSDWLAAPSPTTISVRPGAGFSGTDRVEIIWGANAVKNHWLEVKVLPTANTGLAVTNAFFWGNKIGDTGNPSVTDFSTVVAGDGGLVINSLGAGAGITNVRDIDRTNSVTVAGDRGSTVANLGTLNRLYIEGPGPALSANLANDTGPGGVPNNDGITTDPTVAGTLAAQNGLISFRAGLIGDNLQNVIAPNPLAVNIDWVTVGNPGNIGQLSGGVVPGGGGVNAIVGAVNHSYLIGKYDVTNSQYTEFLNRVDAGGANLLGLYESRMGTDLDNGGIAFNAAAANGSKYSVMPGRGNYPVTFVSWFDSIRFANWLNNGQGDGDTETGAYTIPGGSDLGWNIKRNLDAKVFLPSDDEWYKAAFYNPATASYYIFPTSSNTLPGYGPPPADNNSANYVPGGNPGMRFDLSVGHVTEVGAYTTTVGPYGTYDQGGNVLQWNETLINTPTGLNRGARGGSFNEVWDHMSAAYRGSFSPSVEGSNTSIRVASVVPSTNALPLVQPNGTFSLSSSFLDTVAGGPLLDGSYTLQLTATDAHQLVTLVELPFTLKRSVTAPQLPDLVSSSDSGSSNSDNITDVSTPSIFVTAEAGSLVTLYVDGVPAGQLLANPTAYFISPALTEGTHTFVATGVDGAGNVSGFSPSLVVTITSAPPAASPSSLSAPADGGSATGGSDTNAIASSLAAPAVLSQPSAVSQSSTTIANASDARAPSGSGVDTAYAPVDDEADHGPNPRSERGAGSANNEIVAIDLALVSLADEQLL